MPTLFLATTFALPKPLGRLADLIESPWLLALWGIALLLLFSLPFLYGRLRRRKVRRSYPRNPLEASPAQQPQQKESEYRDENLAEAFR